MQPFHAQPFSLEFLRTLGADALDAAAIPGLSAMVLRRLELCLNHPVYKDLLFRQHSDLFAAAAAANTPLIPPEAIPVSAELDFYFTGASHPRSVELKPPNTLILESATDAPLVEHWLARCHRAASPPSHHPTAPAASTDLTHLTHSPPPPSSSSPPPPPTYTAIYHALADIHQELAAVRSELGTPHSVKQRLDQMQHEGLFAFTRKVDPTAFRLCSAILAEGDVAKASRALGLSDSALRKAVERWHGRGEAYDRMLELVRWRKRLGRKQKVRFNEAILYEKADTVDYPELLAEVLEQLLGMSQDNWEERCEELAERLRPVVGPGA